MEYDRVMKIETVIGFLASMTAACIFFPQVRASYKTKNTRSLAWSGIIIGMLNGILWVSYGVLKLDPFIYVTNTILFIGAFLLMLLKRKYH